MLLQHLDFYAMSVEDEAVNASTRLLSVDNAQFLEHMVNSFRQILNERKLLPPSQDDRGTMLRFLWGKNHDLDKAAQLWEKMIKWRRENGVDTIIQEFIDTEYEDVQGYYPQCFHGIDKKGHPIYIDCLGKADCSKLKNVTNVDRFLRFHIFGFEKAFAEKFPACSRNIYSMTRIVDLDGLHWDDSTSAALDIFNRMEKINFEYYPQRIHETFYVNAGMGLRMIWAVTKFLARVCKNPVRSTHVLGRNYQNKLLKVIDEDQLPIFLGGSCSCQGEGGCLRSEKGPWKNSIKAESATVVPNLEIHNADLEIHNAEEALPALQVENALLEMINNVDQTLLELKASENTELEERVDALSEKLDNIHAALDQLLVVKQQSIDRV